MKTREIRELYLSYFERHEHVRRPSASLVPANDPTLLFTSAGMNQFKDYFLGKGPLPFTRAVTSQRCLRTGDIGNVGRTASHHTFFEMLGNFSFDDYFQREAITWAWDFLLKVLGIDPERLCVSVFHDDREAFDIWHDEVGLPKNLIYKLGEADNFWPANARTEGPNGPCGPCSEIFFDQGEDFGCGLPDCGPECDCDRYVEIWNLVFTQFDRQDGGVLKPLGRNNVDTGMGLERVARVMQGKSSNFEIDIFEPIIGAICDRLGVAYEFHTETGSRIRRICDHVRALCGCIADSIMPSNEGRGYVLRRLLRRAACDGRYLGASEPFLFSLAEAVAETLSDVFPELAQRKDVIERVIRHEEMTFGATLNQGLRMIEEQLDRLKSEGKTVLSGEDAFKLYDTHGFPLELTESILADHGMSVDLDDFHSHMERQRERARSASMFGGEVFAGDSIEGLAEDAEPTRFEGYRALVTQSTVVAVVEGKKAIEQAAEGGRVSLLLDVTPFYARAGGQVGDAGVIRGEEFEFVVEDTTTTDGFYLHAGKVTKGTVRAGMKAVAEVNAARRADIAANHTATHILHWALREVLGTHVAQAGSEVSDERLRFDFSHLGTVKPAELAEIERLANRRIMEGAAVRTVETSLEEAKEAGALALFDEKYADHVRMVCVGDFSKELCGGTHVDSVSSIGLFKIVGEEAVASGIRRITAVTRLRAYEAFKVREEQLIAAASEINAQPTSMAEKVAALARENKRLRKEIENLRAKDALRGADDLLAAASVVGPVKVVAEVVKGVGREELRKLADSLVKKDASLAVVLGADVDGNAAIVAACGKEAVKNGVHAGNLAKAAAKVVGGGGGGRPQIAQAGGGDLSKLEAAMKEAAAAVSQNLE